MVQDVVDGSLSASPVLYTLYSAVLANLLQKSGVRYEPHWQHAVWTLQSDMII
jgi:hypothetical protein